MRGSGNEEIVTGAGGSGGPHVKVLSGSGALLGNYFAYPAVFTGGVRVGAGDLDGDGDGEVVTTPGPGRTVLVRILD